MLTSGFGGSLSFSNCQLSCWGVWRFFQHPECSNTSRVDKSDANQSGNPLLLHTLQREAILKAKEEKKSYVLTSGTGSGKSLANPQPAMSRGVASHSIGEKRWCLTLEFCDSISLPSASVRTLC